MSRLPRPCVDCGDLVPTGTRCQPCDAAQPASPRRPRPSRPRAWRRLSAKARAMSPFCSVCGTEQDLTADHLVPTSLGGPMLPGLAGLDVKCRPCNARAYAEQQAEHEAPREGPATHKGVPRPGGSPGERYSGGLSSPGAAL